MILKGRRKRLEGILKGMEYSKQYIMREINALGLNDETVRRTTVYPVGKVKPMYIEGYPVFHFGYEGALPYYDKEDHEYNSMVKQYYYSATFDGYDYSKLTLPVMEKATIVFVHYFNDMKIRDLDNRSRKYVQDAIRLTGIIKDDNWQNVWNLDIGFYDKNKSHVQVYVVPTDNFPHFIGYLIKNHKEMSIELEDLPKRKVYEKEFLRLQKIKEQEKETKHRENQKKSEKEESMFF